MLAAIALAWTGSGASALVIPGTPEYEMREHETYEVPSYYREVRISYHSSEKKPADRAREIRLAYPRQKGQRRRGASLLDRARSARGAESKSAGNDASASSSTARATVNYRNSTQYRDRRQGRVSLRIPGRSRRRLMVRVGFSWTQDGQRRNLQHVRHDGGPPHTPVWHDGARNESPQRPAEDRANQ